MKVIQKHFKITSEEYKKLHSEDNPLWQDTEIFVGIWNVCTIIDLVSKKYKQPYDYLMKTLSWEDIYGLYVISDYLGTKDLFIILEWLPKLCSGISNLEYGNYNSNLFSFNDNKIKNISRNMGSLYANIIRQYLVEHNQYKFATWEAMTDATVVIMSSCICYLINNPKSNYKYKNSTVIYEDIKHEIYDLE